MVEVAQKLPEAVPELQQIVADERARVSYLMLENRLLREQIALLRAHRFGRSSEQVRAEQYRLFNEAEDLVEDTAETSEPKETIEVPAHHRKKGGRRPLPADLPRTEVIHDLSEEEKICPHDGHRLKPIGEEISEQLDIIPAQVQVIRHVRRKYACPCCAQGVKTAALPPQPIPKSVASPGTLAFVATSKFVDGLSLYRIEKILDRLRVDVSRATLANWIVRCGIMVQVLINLLNDALLEGTLIRMDETTLQVLNELVVSRIVEPASARVPISICVP